jgi:hypothetical protein
MRIANKTKWTVHGQIHARLETALPPSLYRDIGRITFKFSALEYQLNQLVYALAGVDREIGRLAIRSPRAEELIELINDLVDARGMNVGRIDSQLKTEVGDAQANRDLLAHGVWVKSAETGELRIVTMRGKFPVPGAVRGRSRSHNPVTVDFNSSHAAAITASIEQSTQKIDLYFRSVLSELGASPETLRKPLDPKDRKDGRKSKT